MAKAHEDRIANVDTPVKNAKRHRCTEGITSGEVTVRHSPLVSSLVSIIIIFFFFFGSEYFGKGAAEARAPFSSLKLLFFF